MKDIRLYYFFLVLVLLNCIFISPLYAAAADSANVSPPNLLPKGVQSPSTYLLMTGQTALFCNNGNGVKHAPSQYKSYTNCQSPLVADQTGVPLVCASGTMPVSQVAFAMADTCKVPGSFSTCGGQLAYVIVPANGSIQQVATFSFKKKQWNYYYQITVTLAYAHVIGNIGTCGSGNYPNTAIAVNYAIFCVPCPRSGCKTPPIGAYMYAGPSTLNNGMYPMSTWQQNKGSAPWCGFILNND